MLFPKSEILFFKQRIDERWLEFNLQGIIIPIPLEFFFFALRQKLDNDFRYQIHWKSIFLLTSMIRKVGRQN